MYVHLYIMAHDYYSIIISVEQYFMHSILCIKYFSNHSLYTLCIFRL